MVIAQRIANIELFNYYFVPKQRTTLSYSIKGLFKLKNTLLLLFIGLKKDLVKNYQPLSFRKITKKNYFSAKKEYYLTFYINVHSQDGTYTLSFSDSRVCSNTEVNNNIHGLPHYFHFPSNV